MPISEVVIIPTYKRPEFLRCCIERIRWAEPHIHILVFPDRFSADEDVVDAVRPFGGVTVAFVPKHTYHGNSFNTMEAFRFAYNAGYDRFYYVEDDVMVHEDFFVWHREQHEEMPGIFASMAWVFNQVAPISDDIMFQPWYYSIGTCFSRKKLGLVVQHASPLYYADMHGYIERTFKGSRINSPFGIQHYEQDGLIQRILDVDKSQTVSSGIAKCTHLGNFGYNRGWHNALFFEGCNTFNQRVERIEEFMADPYWRAEVFGRAMVEREIGHLLPKREFKYTMTVPGGWESAFTSELEMRALPRRLNSVPVSKDTRVVLDS